jgi:type II secretory pathway pseudopilin PulG
MNSAQGMRASDAGFAMAALLVAMAVMALVMSALLPVWRTLSIREKEEELMWRGQQYDRAIQLYRKKNAAPGAPNVEALIQGRFLRKKFKDPITNGDFEFVGVNAGIQNAPGAQQPPRGVGQLIGSVRSKSAARSFREPDGATTYKEWQFTYVPWKPSGQTVPPGAAGSAGPMGPGGRGGPGTRPGSQGSGPGGRGTGPGRGRGRGGPGQGGTRGPGSGVIGVQEPAPPPPTEP